tara:strand:+ start:1452 stop:1613 length:162 start_codon:yes stop_codon:yes gene_type:complete
LLEKLLILCADSEFAQEIYEAIDKLEERKGTTNDTTELRNVVENTIKLCQKIR